MSANHVIVASKAKSQRRAKIGVSARAKVKMSMDEDDPRSLMTRPTSPKDRSITPVRAVARVLPLSVGSAEAQDGPFLQHTSSLPRAVSTRVAGAGTPPASARATTFGDHQQGPLSHSKVVARAGLTAAYPDAHGLPLEEDDVQLEDKTTELNVGTPPAVVFDTTPQYDERDAMLEDDEQPPPCPPPELVFELEPHPDPVPGPDPALEGEQAQPRLSTQKSSSLPRCSQPAAGTTSLRRAPTLHSHS